MNHFVYACTTFFLQFNSISLSKQSLQTLWPSFNPSSNDHPKPLNWYFSSYFGCVKYNVYQIPKEKFIITTLLYLFIFTEVPILENVWLALSIIAAQEISIKQSRMIYFTLCIKNLGKVQMVYVMSPGTAHSLHAANNQAGCMVQEGFSSSAPDGQLGFLLAWQPQPRQLDC